MTQLLALAGFGFLLGMRHATDADHVIAVTTILNRSRRFLDTTLIGALWGLGHTITVVIVGMLIIVFNVVIPPPVGLAMEFAVAVMLIALGILNLTGGLSWLTERMTPPAPIHAHDHAATAGRRTVTSTAMVIRSAAVLVVATLGRYQLLQADRGRPGAWARRSRRPWRCSCWRRSRTPGPRIVYLVIFCVGVAAGMAVLTTVIGLPFMVSRGALGQDQPMADDRLRAALARVRAAPRL